MEVDCSRVAEDILAKAKRAVCGVLDPEVPVLNIDEMGILQRVHLEDEIVIITITPTYLGCPAMDAIKVDIGSSLNDVGVEKYRIDIVYSPAWTTDWLSIAARRKLKAYGISPPMLKNEIKTSFEEGKSGVECPLCESKTTSLVSEIGSTACKSMYKCSNCLEPFEYFKCL